MANQISGTTSFPASQYVQETDRPAKDRKGNKITLPPCQGQLAESKSSTNKLVHNANALSNICMPEVAGNFSSQAGTYQPSKIVSQPLYVTRQYRQKHGNYHLYQLNRMKNISQKQIQPNLNCRQVLGFQTGRSELRTNEEAPTPNNQTQPKQLKYRSISQEES